MFKHEFVHALEHYIILQMSKRDRHQKSESSGRIFAKLTSSGSRLSLRICHHWLEGGESNTHICPRLYFWFLLHIFL